MSSIASDIRDLHTLSTHKLRDILEVIGGVAVIYTSKENQVSRVQQGSMRSRIIEKLSELQAQYGQAILTDKGSLVEGQAKEEYVAWYLQQRADDVNKRPDKDYKKWALVHLADSIKHRKEAVGAAPAGL